MSAETLQIVLGTRGSELAREQTRLVETAIQCTQLAATLDTKIISTRGDKPVALEARAGRKGLFTAEIERALLAGDIDIAVHSAKDLPSETTAGLEIAAVLPRAPIDDVLVSKHSGGLASLPQSATVATGSVRRQRQLLWKRADLDVIALRGNVPTRLRKLVQNEWDAVVLARAGLERLGIWQNREEVTFESRSFFLETLSCETFLPAGGQGIIALQIRTKDRNIGAILDHVNDPDTLLCFQAEREFLRGLHGDCNCPVGVLATIANGNMRLRAQVFPDDSAAPREAEIAGHCEEGATLALQLLRIIRA